LKNIELNTTSSTQTAPLEAPALAVSGAPIAMIAGIPMADQPHDLFIPPDALTVFLNAFEGPLDLLLYLIRKHKFDILDLPVSKITEQYMEYVDLMKELNLDLAAEYLLMAAILAEIKSRMLLPVEVDVDDDGYDPRADLVERLKEYEQFKQAALDLDGLPRLERDVFIGQSLLADNMAVTTGVSQVTLQELTTAFASVLKRIDVSASHHISREALSTRARMSQIMTQLAQLQPLAFHQLFAAVEGRSGAVVSFLAILQLCKEQLIGIALDGTEVSVFTLELDNNNGTHI